jgi:hypothetical protein
VPPFLELVLEQVLVLEQELVIELEQNFEWVQQVALPALTLSQRELARMKPERFSLQL